MGEPTAAKYTADEVCLGTIILNVLMPEAEGWSVLQTLRATPEFAHIPVIVYSVINDPELATALDAAASLKEPLSRLDLMEALHQARQGARMR